MTDKIVVYSTCSGAEEAKQLASHLIEQRLAACVNVCRGVDSYYRWQGKVQQEAEVLLVIKTSRELFDRLRTEWERLHSYEIPELVAVPIVACAPDYLNWMESEIGPEKAAQ
ncbi:MAG TPA: divalent-cation tolerance protein CutA [Bryobacterales bacterium]|jgi:periplasmic divalent cation tolerance protein|nr:divalent-cation tolerance protein CutA [Bryobacterales bacterium]